MTRALWCSLVLLSAIVALPSAQVPSDADARIRHTVIAASGDAAPAGGTYLFLLHQCQVEHTARGHVRCGRQRAPLTTGVFVGDGRTTSAIALGTSPDPAVPSFGEVFNPFVTANGNVVFQANFSDIFVADGRHDRCARAKWGSGARRRHPDGGKLVLRERPRHGRVSGKPQRHDRQPGNFPHRRERDRRHRAR